MHKQGMEYLSIFMITMFSLICNSLSSTFVVVNNCRYTIWPATLAGAGTPQLVSTGFRLDSGQNFRISVNSGWSGRVWARTGCEFNELGTGICQTGDCGGKLECGGVGASPPVTLFEITVGTNAGCDDDFYDVSVVDGYNLPMEVSPRAAHGDCNATGCVADLNLGCPKELQVTKEVEGVVACKSACEAFGLAEYCCSGEFANPNTCRPSIYSNIFKTACPKAYSYAFDDRTSTFVCKAMEYTITFCPINQLNETDGVPTCQTMGQQTSKAIVQASSSPVLLSKIFSESVIILSFLFILYF